MIQVARESTVVGFRLGAQSLLGDSYCWFVADDVEVQFGRTDDYVHV